eukprot:gene9921-10078_t
MELEYAEPSNAAKRTCPRNAAEATQPLPKPDHAATAAAAPADMLPSPTLSGDASGIPTNSHTLAGAVQTFHGGVSNMQQALANLVSALTTEKQHLDAAKRQLAEDQAAFAQECSRVQQVLCDRDQVTLNVGGHRFTTTVSTLRDAPSPSLFAAMFSGRHALVHTADGSIFLDRDGRHFADILNFLRTQQLAYPPDGTDFKYLLELRAEAEFYGLVGLVQQIDRFPFGLVRVVRGQQRSCEDTWVYEDGRDEVVLCVDKPCQLLGVGLCGSDSGYTAILDVLRVADDFSEELFLCDPVMLLPDNNYMLSLSVRGSESYCCEECMETVVAGGVTVSFQCWESSNGTNEERGQFPEVYIRPARS